MVAAECDVGLVALPAGWTRKLDAVAGKLQYMRFSGTPAWAPVEIVRHENERRRLRALCLAAP
eukprot:10777422-Alexandrium_andersonii.AAC.1